MTLAYHLCMKQRVVAGWMGPKSITIAGNPLKVLLMAGHIHDYRCMFQAWYWTQLPV